MVLGSCGTTVEGQELIAPPDGTRVIECGKAAAARRLLAAPQEAPTQAYLETMTDTDVLHNVLDIEVTNVNPGGNTCTLTGSNTMTIKSKSSSLTEFRFRLRSQFTITSATVNGATPVTVTTESTSTRLVTLDRAYALDETFTLAVAYTGNTVSAAFGSIEVDTHSGGIPVVATLSEPYYAYTWWPAKDGDAFLPGDNTDKATLDFWVTVPGTYTVASNGTLEGVDTLSGSRKRFRWSTNYPIVTYLVSFSATQYNTFTNTYVYPGGTMPVDFYIYPGNDTGSNRTEWGKAVTMLATFRPLFGEYPFIAEKYGIYNFPFGGGMEHQTMTGQSGFSEGLTSHELAHQWWGDAVTCKTWNHIWLNEGFASYAEALWDEHKPGSSGLPALKSTMASMRYTGSGSVYVYDNEVNQLFEIFNGSTSYNKGAWVLHMLRHVLGDAAFYEALAAYRAAYEDGAATTEDFQAVCEAYYPGGNLGWFFLEWVYGEWVPSYSWGWSSVVVEGKDYLLVSVDQVQNASQQRFTMPIDIVVDGVTHEIFNDVDAEHFVIPVASAPTTVQFDPDTWILTGTRSQVAYVPGPPTIVETSPAPGQRVGVSESGTSVRIKFHTGVNISAADVSLVGDVGGPQAFTLTSIDSGRIVVLNLPASLADDIYTLTVSGTVVATATGLQLDGELEDPGNPNSLPSGDGLPGGDAVIRFTVSRAVPAVSDWGLLVLAGLTLAVGAVVMRRRTLMMENRC